MLRFNDLLRAVDIAPEETAVLLHTPRERRFARVLPFLAMDAPDVLEAFQSVHSERATATLKRRRFMASFVRVEAGTLAFVGVFQNNGCAERPAEALLRDPSMRRVVHEFGANTILLSLEGRTWPAFDFERLPALSDYVGRVQIRPKLTQSYARLAENLDAEIVALSEGSILAAAAPDWRDFIVTAPEIRALPRSWAARLREWRGVYMILDQADGKRYVGSAYGAENLLGRWQHHVAATYGITAHLKGRRTDGFRFSILERVSPDLPAEEVIALEHGWMDRLGTRDFGLNA